MPAQETMTGEPGRRVSPTALSPRPDVRPRGRPSSRIRRLPRIAQLAVGLEILLSIGALLGGSQLVLGPDGHLVGLPLSLLASTPFHSYLVPGILLFTCIGLAPIVAVALTFGWPRIAPIAAVAVGLTLMGWITVEMVMFAGFTSLLWAFYLILGTTIAAVGVAWRRHESHREIMSAGGA